MKEAEEAARLVRMAEEEQKSAEIEAVEASEKL